jgi:hypothetical protein
MLAAGLAAALAATSLAACGESSSNSSESEGSYAVKVTKATFPTKQALGQTSLLRIGIANRGKKTVPATAVTISIAGKEGESSTLPFGIRDRQPDLAQPDRPVWVVAEGYPKAAGETTKRGGATTSGRKTFNFGPLKRGKSVEGIWKLSAVKAGRYTVMYSVGAGLGGKAKAETANGVQPGGSFKVLVTDVTPETEVTDSGEVVEIGGSSKGQGKKNSGG